MSWKDNAALPSFRTWLSRRAIQNPDIHMDRMEYILELYPAWLAHERSKKIVNPLVDFSETG